MKSHVIARAPLNRFEMGRTLCGVMVVGNDVAGPGEKPTCLRCLKFMDEKKYQKPEVLVNPSDILQFGVWEKDTNKFRPCVAGKDDAMSLAAVGHAAGMDVQVAVVVPYMKEPPVVEEPFVEKSRHLCDRRDCREYAVNLVQSLEKGIYACVPHTAEAVDVLGGHVVISTI